MSSFFLFLFSPASRCVSILVQQRLATTAKRIATQARENLTFKETPHFSLNSLQKQQQVQYHHDRFFYHINKSFGTDPFIYYNHRLYSIRSLVDRKIDILIYFCFIFTFLSSSWWVSGLDFSPPTWRLRPL